MAYEINFNRCRNFGSFDSDIQGINLESGRTLELEIVRNQYGDIAPLAADRGRRPIYLINRFDIRKTFVRERGTAQRLGPCLRLRCPRVGASSVGPTTSPSPGSLRSDDSVDVIDFDAWNEKFVARRSRSGRSSGGGGGSRKCDAALTGPGRARVGARASCPRIKYLLSRYF
ncbi:hypothetical protein EVAR_45543_1 [Eumeta japonica]|uniref:Uncharacterized protein n=1 Tax=Eumeta variegata TaxID=151549 RepID=A0A4C1X860_EUMVA|nr:hypothetical protein EVAR_45543_1 [Eumeta japonica]